MSQTVIPVFPCHSLKATLAFYNAMGFETLHEQHAPYVYGSVRFEQIQIDFYGGTAVATPQESGHMCLAIVTDIQNLHATFASGLKQQFGKRPRSGIPRLGSVNSVSKDQRFNLLDPNGNRIIVIEAGTGGKPKPKRATPLSKAISMARLDAYSRDEPRIAAEVLDKALQHCENEPTVTQFRALVIRADVAAVVGDAATFQRMLQAASDLASAANDQPEAAEEYERFGELQALAIGQEL